MARCSRTTRPRIGCLIRRELATIEVDAQAINVAVLDSEGSRVACAPWRRSVMVEVWASESGEQIAKLPAPGREVSALQFSADGRLLLVVASNGRMQLWDTATWRRVDGSRAPGPVPLASAISADGDWIVVAGEGQGGSHLDVWRPSRASWRRLAEGLPGTVRALTIAGDQLAVAMDVRFQPGAPAAYLWSRDAGLQPLSFPPDGRGGQTKAKFGPRLDAVAFDPSARTLMLVGGMACTGWGVQAWTSIDAGPLRGLDLGSAEVGQSASWLRAVAIRSDGGLVAVGDGVTVWGAGGAIAMRLDHGGAPVAAGGVLLCSSPVAY